MSAKEKLTIEALRLEPAYAALSEKQRAMVEAFVASGHDKFAAYKATHPACKTEKSLIACANKAFSLPAMRAVLNVYFQTDPLNAVKADIRRAMLNRRLTPAQASMVRLYAAAHGIGVDSLPTPEPVAPADAPKGKVLVDKVVEQNGRRLHSVITDIGAVEIS
jgi:hypothetical protein